MEVANTKGEDHMERGTPTTPHPAMAEMSREVVHIHSQHFGRGPTKARTVWRDDVVVVILEEIFTRAEQTVIQAGHFDEVRAIRQAFQDEVAPLLRQAIEQATGRRVRTFMSQVNADGIAAEIFLLERGRGGPD